MLFGLCYAFDAFLPFRHFLFVRILGLCCVPSRRMIIILRRKTSALSPCGRNNHLFHSKIASITTTEIAAAVQMCCFEWKWTIRNVLASHRDWQDVECFSQNTWFACDLTEKSADKARNVDAAATATWKCGKVQVHFNGTHPHSHMDGDGSNERTQQKQSKLHSSYWCCCCGSACVPLHRNTLVTLNQFRVVPLPSLLNTHSLIIGSFTFGFVRDTQTICDFFFVDAISPEQNGEWII